MISQLFHNNPEQKIVLNILNILGFTDIHSKKIIYMSEMEKMNVLVRFNEIINVIKDYYIPCKKKYCEDLNLKKCINITRQFLKTINYDLISNVYYFNNKRIRGYRIVPLYQKKFIKNKFQIEIKFD
jgi:hypothetical protein